MTPPQEAKGLLQTSAKAFSEDKISSQHPSSLCTLQKLFLKFLIFAQKISHPSGPSMSGCLEYVDSVGGGCVSLGRESTVPGTNGASAFTIMTWPQHTHCG